MPRPALPATIDADSVLEVDGVLREVVDSDLDAFFEHQREPEANRMAAFPARDREAFDAHWRRLLADDSLTKKTIVYEGEVAGNVGCWEQEGRRLVGYWIGREFWGKGLATRALQELTGEVTLSDRCTRGSRRATSPRSACSRSAGSSTSPLAKDMRATSKS